MIQLKNISAKPPEGFKKAEAKAELKDLKRRLSELQYVMRAEKKHSALIVLQGMDASGKDGTIRRVFGGLSPASCRVASFKKPTPLEMDHDFLWRVHKQVPAKGEIVIFNRSHYEDVLIQRVHSWIDEETVFKRFDAINHFEQLLQQNGTIILKFYLHISKDEQLIQLKERTTERRKFWKHNPNDFREREHWDEYRKAYEDVFKHCSPEIRWQIIPADVNRYKEVLIARSVCKAMAAADMQFPDLVE